MQATNIIISTDHIDITLSSDVQRGDTLNAQYIPGTNKVQGLSGNEAAAFNQAVTIALWPNGVCSGLSLVVDSYDQITANWINGSTDETGISIERSLDNITWAEIIEIAAGLETYSNTGLEGSTLYYYRVRAVKNGYYSDYTTTESATTEAGMPAVLSDANAIFVYEFDDLTTITKDGSNFVSRWNDKNLSGRDLIQATGSKQPLWTADGILFDGIDNFMQTAAFIWDQPEFIFIVFKLITWTNTRMVFAGNEQASGILWQTGAAGSLYINAGLNVKMTPNIGLDTFGIARILFNGASSKVIINASSPVTGDASSANMGMFVLGSRTNGLNPAYIKVQGVIGRNLVPSAGDEIVMYNYFATKWGYPTI